MAEEVWSDPTASVLGGDIGGFLSYPAADAALTVTPAPPPPAPPSRMEDDEPMVAWQSDRRAPAARPTQWPANAPVRTAGRPAQRPGATRPRPGPPARPTDPRSASVQMKGAMRERRGSSSSGLLLVLLLALVVAFVVLTSLG